MLYLYEEYHYLDDNEIQYHYEEIKCSNYEKATTFLDNTKFAGNNDFSCIEAHCVCYWWMIYCGY